MAAGVTAVLAAGAPYIIPRFFAPKFEAFRRTFLPLFLFCFVCLFIYFFLASVASPVRARRDSRRRVALLQREGDVKRPGTAAEITANNGIRTRDYARRELASGFGFLGISDGMRQ